MTQCFSCMGPTSTHPARSRTRPTRWARWSFGPCSFGRICGLVFLRLLDACQKRSFGWGDPQQKQPVVAAQIYFGSFEAERTLLNNARKVLLCGVRGPALDTSQHSVLLLESECDNLSVPVPIEFELDCFGFGSNFSAPGIFKSVSDCRHRMLFHSIFCKT